MKAIVLTDNIACDGFKGEWGLSIYIEYVGHKILLDTGASELFAENAGKLGIDLKTIEALIISHAHYDHGNGMAVFFKLNTSAPCYIQKSARENCYFKKGPIRKYIGLPKNILTDYSERLHLAEGKEMIFPGCWLIAHQTPNLAAVGKSEQMYCKTENGWQPDDFSHEQSLVFDTDSGLIIFNSCCHGGAANIINEIKMTFPKKKVFALIGGFHLYNKKEEAVRLFAEQIKETGIEYVCTGHCTGEKAYKILKEELRDRLHPLHVNLEMNF